MGGAHTRSAGRRPGPTGHPAGLGWWQPPRAPRSAGPDEPPPRHRSRVPPVPRRTPAERRRRIGRVLAGTVVTAVAGPMFVFTLGYLLFAVPDPADAVPAQVALVSFADGSQLGQLTPAASDTGPVPLDRVPAHVRAAVLAAEDRTFYGNPGFDVGGLARAAWDRVRGGSGDGATITEQYVRQTGPAATDSPWRRFRELVVAVKLAQQREKDEILAGYLNAAYYGRGSFGIEAASRAYFGKGVGELSPAEGALLAGLIDTPADSDPAVHPERAQRRWTAVLDGMTSAGWLDRGVRAAAVFPGTGPGRPATGELPPDDRGHILAAVTAELAGLGLPEPELRRGQLRVTTTVDPLRQQQAVAATSGILDGQPADLRGAMVAIDPATGGVLAYYGGRDGRGPDYAQAPRLAGSTFTPFLVLAGLLSTPPVAPDEISTLARRIGPEAVTAAARAAGAATDGRETSPYDLASAYATLAADGVWRPPHLVASVSGADGRVLYRAAPDGEQRFDPNVARTVTATMLRGTERRGLKLPGGRPVATRDGSVDPARFGTVNDTWMAGFTPGLATSVWLGPDRSAPAARAPRSTAARRPGLPGNAWRMFMAEALSEQPVQQFDPPGAPGPTPTSPAPPPAPAPAPAGTGSATPSPTAAPTRPNRPPNRPAPADPRSGPSRPSRTPATPPSGSTTGPPASSSTTAPDRTGTAKPTPRPTSKPTSRPTAKPGSGRADAEPTGTRRRARHGAE